MNYILTGLLGGLVVGIIIYVFNYVKQKRFEKKHTIAGKYITTFEDEKDGEIVNYTALAELKQKGNKITGYTYLSEESRKWSLEGRISTDGYFYGIYNTGDPLDKSIGNFFLTIDKDKNMFGLWSGFDSVNNKINSGKYTFRPLYEKIKFEKLATKHIPHILSLTNGQLGEQYLTNEKLKTIITDNNNYFGKVAIGSDGKTIGFYICNILDISEFKKILDIPEENIPEFLKLADKVGVLKTVVVDENLQRYGIGTKLVRDSISEFEQHNVKTICAIAWKSKYGINIGNILEKEGFKQILEMKSYWSQDSVDNAYEYPVYGKPPCKYSAVVFNLNL